MAPAKGAEGMIKRTVEVSQNAVHLAVRSRQLLLMPRRIHTNGQPSSNGNGRHDRTERVAPLASIPCEDIGVLLVDQPAVTYTHAALTSLLDHDAAVILCGGDHLPAGLLLPLGEHSEIVWRIRDQITVGKPTQKRIWQQIIRAKIRAQAANLPAQSQSRTKLLALARKVRSGDPDNIEAQAAKAYWSAWRNAIDDPDMSMRARGAVGGFRRDPDGAAPNNLLNYGYAVIRAAVARALVSAGLFPVIGIKHSSRSNAFCLADDLVEPLRPAVDAVVADLVVAGELELTPETKRPLLELLAAETVMDETTGPLMVALHRYVAAFHRCLVGGQTELACPVLVRPEDVDAASPEVNA